MNALQRVILVAGTLGVLGVIFATPRVVIHEGKVLPSDLAPEFGASVIDVRTVGFSAVGVAAATIFLFLAATPKGRGSDRLSIVEGRVDKLARDLAALESHVTEP